MKILVLYLCTTLFFFVIDFFGLRYIVKPVFDADIGDMLRETPRYGPALVFYLFFVGGLVWFASLPALKSGAGLGQVWLTGAVLGALAYGTYEFSNMATLNGWTWRMLWTDFLWGTALSGTATALGLVCVRLIWR